MSKPSTLFDFAGKKLDLSVSHVMGILNVTPDSFSDGGELMNDSGLVSLSKVLERAEQMVNAGAAILDIGGESTRPGAKEVSSQQEIDRVLPVVEAVKRNLDVIISVDTSNPELIRQCPAAGAGLINDVRALAREGALEASASAALPVCLMHMQGSPKDMQNAPGYDDIITDIAGFLAQRVKACNDAGIANDRILLDPGFGFGKTLEHNLELLSRLDELQALKLPLLIGVSRKRMIGTITGRSEKDRIPGSIAAAVIGVMNGARLVRTHDVAETVDALKICKRSAEGSILISKYRVKDTIIIEDVEGGNAGELRKNTFGTDGIRGKSRLLTLSPRTFMLQVRLGDGKGICRYRRKRKNSDWSRTPGYPGTCSNPRWRRGSPRPGWM